MQGVDVLKRWRKENRDFPVLVLKARGTWSEKVDGLNAGAEDYVTKPVHVPEVARLNELIQRSAGLASVVLRHGDLGLDTATGKASFKVNSRSGDRDRADFSNTHGLNDCRSDRSLRSERASRDGAGGTLRADRVMCIFGRGAATPAVGARICQSRIWSRLMAAMS